jgi:hypothetical protein
VQFSLVEALVETGIVEQNMDKLAREPSQVGPKTMPEGGSGRKHVGAEVALDAGPHHLCRLLTVVGAGERETQKVIKGALSKRGLWPGPGQERWLK